MLSVMRKLFFNLPLVAILLVAVACQNDRSKEQTDADERTEERAEKSEDIATDANKEKFDDKNVKNDADFVAEQVAANLAEVRMAKLASEKSSLPDIKKVAKMLETEHSKKLQELQKLANQKSITVPIEADKDAIQTVQNLRDEKDAKNFNEEWCKEMVDKHEKTIEAYEDKLEDTQDPELKSWISQTLPGLRSHLDQLKACHEKLKDA
jgi:putative membrane protein